MKALELYFYFGNNFIKVLQVGVEGMLFYCIFVTGYKFSKMNTGKKYSKRDLIEDFVLLNECFARRYNLSWRDAFNYLKQYGGLAFYEKHYGYEHTQSYESSVDTLAEICKRNGGTVG